MVKQKQILLSSLLIILGILVIFGPIYLFPVCQYKGMMIEVKKGGFAPMKCTYTARAEIILGILTIVIALMLMIARESESRRLLNILFLILGVLVILVPTWIIGICMSPTMPCRYGTLPFLELMGGLIIGVTLFNLVSEL